MNRAERRARGIRGKRPVTWCDCCQDAPATTRMWRCPRCGYLAIALLELAAGDPFFETCPNCQP